jgi:hypothetical protein
MNAQVQQFVLKKAYFNNSKHKLISEIVFCFTELANLLDRMGKNKYAPEFWWGKGLV